MHRSPLILTLLLACAGAHAAGPAAQPAYDSAFAGYQKYVEPQVADWKQTNAAIAAVPGHAGHGAGSHGEHAGHDMAPAKPDPHAGHKMAPAKADPHAGHDMTAAKPQPAPKAAPAKPDPHAEHKH